MLTGLVLTALLAAGSGCARPDWIDQTLVTVDVTGVWRGNFARAGAGGGKSNVELTLQQSGPKVKGQLKGIVTGEYGPVEGTVNGDVFRFRTHRGDVTGELQVNGDEMAGPVTASAGPGSVILQRQP
jgi:hypothetical protein